MTPEQRRQAVERIPEIAGFSDTPAGVSLGDTQPVGQRAAQRAAQLLVAGLRIELIDQRMLRCAQPAPPVPGAATPATVPGW